MHPTRRSRTCKACPPGPVLLLSDADDLCSFQLVTWHRSSTTRNTILLAAILQFRSQHISNSTHYLSQPRRPGKNTSSTPVARRIESRPAPLSSRSCLLVVSACLTSAYSSSESSPFNAHSSSDRSDIRDTFLHCLAGHLMIARKL